LLGIRKVLITLKSLKMIWGYVSWCRNLFVNTVILESFGWPQKC
jgi:hypothetical protein